MDKEQIKQYFQLAPVVKKMLASDSELDQVSKMIVAGYEALEQEYLAFMRELNK